MNVLVVGYGSIGSRHVRILKEMGHRVAVVSRRPIEFEPLYDNLASALLAEQPEYVVVANETSKHHLILTELIHYGFDGHVLVEKPLFHKFEVIPHHCFRSIFVAYNLRFHPLLQRVKDFLLMEKILSVQVYVGQYLPYWRPDQDYRVGYSAHKDAGGGVLRDLSHELDYIVWLLGGWKEVVSVGGQYSSLDIDSEDIYSIMLTTPRCEAVTIQMNYLDRLGRRQVIINTDQHTIELDLFNGRIIIDRQEECCLIERDVTYSRQHEAILTQRTEAACTLDQSLSVLRLIQAIERSAVLKEWVKQ